MGLQVADHDTFQRREWKAQRLGWVLFGLLLVAALLGLLGGPGPLSSATAAGTDELLQVDYKRFIHVEADDILTITLAAAAVTGDSVDVELAGDWAESVDISGITPQPQEEVPTSYGLQLTIPTEPGTAVSIQIAYRATEIGGIDGGIRFEGETVPFDQFVYP